MYSDLDKKSTGGFIIKDTMVVSEVFSTAVNIKKGQIFYGRQYGYDFERYLLRLNEIDTILDIQSDLYKIRNLDGRLICDPSKTKMFTDPTDERVLYIQTALNVAGIPWFEADTYIEDNSTDNILVIQDFIEQKKSPWKTEQVEN